MMMDDVIRRIGEIGIVPVVRAATSAEAIRAVEAIHLGGIPIVEITMTVPDAQTVIREVVREYAGRVLVGAGQWFRPNRQSDASTLERSSL